MTSYILQKTETYEEEAGPTDLIRIQGNNEFESKPINYKVRPMVIVRTVSQNQLLKCSIIFLNSKWRYQK